MAKRLKFMIVDGNAILHRAWHALPPMTTKDGVVVNAVYGFVTIFFKALKDLKPDYVAVTFDRREKTFRHKEFKAYKAQRVKQPDEFYQQIPLVKEILAALNIQVYEKVGFEADDVIATLCAAKSIDRPNILSIIVTGDSDTLQLVDTNTEVYGLRKGVSDTVLYNTQRVKEKYDGLSPSQLIDFKGLRGDPTDNIPGVRGVGEKTAIGLLKEFGSIEKMYKAISAKGFKPQKAKQIKITDRILQLLVDNKAMALQSKQLATLIRNVELDFNLADTILKPYNKEEIFKLFQRFEFKSLLGRLPNFGDNSSGESKVRSSAELKKTGHTYCHIIKEKEFGEFLKKLKRQKQFCFDTETDGLDIFAAKLLGISFSWETGTAYYLNEPSEAWLEALKPILENAAIKKIGHNLKFDIKVLKVRGITVAGLYFDTMLASYLLNPGTRTHKLEDVVFRELGYQKSSLSDVVGKPKGQITLEFVDKQKLADYSCGDADYTWRLVAHLKTELEKNELWPLFTEIEMPLIEVLADMELNGIKIDEVRFKKLDQKVRGKLARLTKKIHELAGQDFNISSPQQLKTILFEKLKLSSEGLGKTKTGVSTAAGELEKLRGQHPIIDCVEEYRELSKLLSTYIEALPKLVNPKTGRVHTDFNQTITATGRLSSSNPNLQNIPARTELGQEIRAAFIADKGNKLVAGDYSQIELRVIACLANDAKMKAVFKRGEDIHRVTAAEIYGVPLEKVTSEMRYAAKEVNFGVLYGMGAYGLAWRKGISRSQAKSFIEKYFATFSRVKEYIEEMKADAREKGYVQTLFGRRRYLPEINSGVPALRAAAERMAINMPIQGTAADLMKIAMIAVYHELKRGGTEHCSVRTGNHRARLLLQVHDELVLEVPKDQVKKTAQLLDEKMEKVHKLAVPIKVDTEWGPNWRDMEKIF